MKPYAVLSASVLDSNFEVITKSLQKSIGTDIAKTTKNIIDGNFTAVDLENLISDVTSTTIGGLLDLIAVFGPFVSSIFTTVFSFLTKGEDSPQKLLEKTKEYVNQFIDQKISDYDSQLVQAELIGLMKVVDDFRKSLEDYYNKSIDSISSRITL
ncbi:insecticidal delta-endotoxin Cry8Ea1 family protein [Bacillus thuringiensis]|nr:hypothetical protein BG10_4947 [Bacillus thuringiensis serovar morrisoni]MEE2015719.1 insecticidal delta-endotoxin Cry8Ea1 family protein [Bacillus thuringiensis]NUW50748.1 hypothetical protein [Bacillus thuringiensis]HDR6822428.1 hypothetical protein [Bacillus thuringiensis]